MRNRSQLFTRLAAWLATRLAQILFWTLRMDFRTARENTNPYSTSGSVRFLYCVWHDSMLIPTFAGRHRHSAALTSQHQDGSFVAHILQSVGMATIRGSTNRGAKNRGGQAAIRQILTTARDKHVVMTPDGPRGPRRQLSRGIVFLASKTGRAIVPTAFACARSWKIRGSWTDLMIPKPFARVVLLAGEPMRVPAQLTAEQLNEYVHRLQIAMDDLNRDADLLAESGGKREPRLSNESRSTNGPHPANGPHPTSVPLQPKGPGQPKGPRAETEAISS